MTPSDPTTPESDQRYHDYTGNAIPWYVRVIWIGFWIFAIAYTILYVFPSLRAELFQKL